MMENCIKEEIKYLNSHDYDWARKTVELWGSEDIDYVNQLGVRNLRALCSISLHRVYGLRGRISSTHHITERGYLYHFASSVN